jgi:hypothetical protein
VRAASVIACALVLAAPGGATPDWTANAREAARYAKSRSGAESFAVIDARGRIHGRFLDRPRTSASVIKAMLLVAYLRQPSVRGRELTTYERGLLGPMIRASKNGPATTVLHLLGPGPIYGLAEAAEMLGFRLDAHWGLSDLTARDQARFFRRIDLLVPARHRAYARRLLATIIPRQRWGIPPVAPDGWRLYFKGGWLERSDGWVINQVAQLRLGRRRLAVAVLTARDPTDAYGRATVRGIAERLLAGAG